MQLPTAVERVDKVFGCGKPKLPCQCPSFVHSWFHLKRTHHPGVASYLEAIASGFIAAPPDGQLVEIQPEALWNKYLEHEKQQPLLASALSPEKLRKAPLVVA